MFLEDIIAELENDYAIRYDTKGKYAIIGDYEFQEIKDNQLVVSYRIWKAEDWFEDFEDIIDANTDDVKDVLSHSPEWRLNRF